MTFASSRFKASQNHIGGNAAIDGDLVVSGSLIVLGGTAISGTLSNAATKKPPQRKNHDHQYQNKKKTCYFQFIISRII